MSPARYRAPRGFTLVRVLDAHALGATLLASRDGQRVFVKRLSSRALEDAGARALLADEAAILGVLAGRGAPRLIAAGDDGDGPFLAVEYLPWPALATRGAGGDADPWLRVSASAFRALAEVHEAGVVHGDVSPANVLVADDGSRAALVDFGLATLGRASAAPGPFRGTLLYAAPEVARGEPYDARADLFSLAASLLHVASSEPPRRAEGAALLVEAGERDVAPWAARAGALFPPALRACLAFDAAARPRRAGDVLL